MQAPITSNFLKDLNLETIAAKEKSGAFVARRLQAQHHQSLEAITAFITETE